MIQNKQRTTILFKEVFVAVIGTTPQVLTECLYYYYSKYYGKNRRFSKIIVITTSAGKKAIREGVLLPERVRDLENELGLPNGSIPFSEVDIIELFDERGVALKDIRTSEDNQLATEQIFSVLKEITDDNETRVTATVAGGRKTMSTTMAVAYQIFARQQDELIHLITHDSKFGNPEWYFPTDTDDKTQQLDVSLVPIIKVGRYLGKNLTGNPEAILWEVQDSLSGLTSLKSVSLQKSNILIDGTRFALKPRVAVIMRFLLKRRIMSNCTTDCSGCDQCCISRSELADAAQTGMIEEYELLVGKYSGQFQRYKESRLSADTITLNNRIDEDISRQISTISKLEIPSQYKEVVKINKICLDPGDKKSISYGIILDKEIIGIV
jgi:CRISPR-associated protein (TIGR02584 family)